MTVLELIKESQRILGNINVPVKFLDTIVSPISAVHHNLGIVIEAIEAQIEAEKATQNDANQDANQSEDTPDEKVTGDAE